MTGAGGASVVHEPAELTAAVDRLGIEVSAAHPDGVLLVAVLTGSLFFLSDLVRRVSVPCEVDFLAVSAYSPGTGRVRIVKDLDHDVVGRPVVLVEDIVDTGLTSAYVLRELEGRGAASVAVCALFDRRARRIVPVPVRFAGFEVGDDLLVGFGLDVDGRYRNLPFVASADPKVLEADPDAYVSQLYGR